MKSRYPSGATSRTPEASRARQPSGLQPRPRARVQRQHDRPGDRQQQVDEQRQPRRVVDVPGPVRGRQQVAAGLHSGRRERLGALARPRHQQLRDVDHHVPHHDDLAGDLLAPQRLRRPLGGAQQQRRRVVGEHPVELLGHRPVVGAHARLDVGDRDAELRAGQGSGERRVRVAVHQQHVRPLLRDQRLERRQHARRLPGVGAAAEVEMMVGSWKLQLVEEDAGELVVVVLAGVDEHLTRALAQSGGDRGSLHKLRPVAYDGEYAHRRSGTSLTRCR